MDTSEIWQDIFQNLKANADTYLSSEQIRNKYKNPNTTITFRVDDMNHKINALVKKTSDNTYDILILAGLVGELNNFSKQAISTYPNLFKHIDRQDQQKTTLASSYLLYLWLDFIFCHEWAHVLCGHLDFHNEVNEWYELANEEFSPKVISDLTTQALEAEADSYATKFSLARFSTYWEALSKDLYPISSEHVALSDYIMAMLILFQSFEEIRIKSKKPINTHPSPFNRAFIFLAFSRGEYDNIPGLPRLSPKDKESLFGGTAVEFYVKWLGYKSKDYLSRSATAANFLTSVETTIKQLGVKKFRITQ